MADIFLSPSSKVLSQQSEGRIGVLLINLGTPDKATVKSVRTYLREFLSDKRVVEMSPWKWKIILNLFVLPFRSKRVLKNYERIWDKEHASSPLRVITESQSNKLSERLRKSDIQVAWAMRYGSPNVAAGCKELLEGHCNKIVVIPLYPQYSSTTTATANDAVFKAMQLIRVQPAIHTVTSFSRHELYIKALENSVRSYFSNKGSAPERLILSFHGIPVSYEKRGDPYRFECEKTFEALKETLKDLISADKFLLTYQSRFGREEWLTPYTQGTVEDLARNGVKDIAIMTPGFMADCLETLDEVDREIRDAFLHNGGEKFTFIPCINDGEDTIDLLEDLVLKAVRGY